MTNIPPVSPIPNLNIEPEDVSSNFSPQSSEDIIKEQITKIPFQSRDTVMKLLAKLGEDGISEILMNGKDKIFLKKEGQRFYLNDITFPTTEIYHDVINEILLPLSRTKAKIGSSPNLIEGRFEMTDPLDRSNKIFARIHIIAPPAVKEAKVTIAKKARYTMTLDKLRQSGSMSPAMAEFLKAISKARVNTVFSGLSGSGKTTLIETMSQHFDSSDRVIVVEETPELTLHMEDVVYLPARSYRPGDMPEDMVTVEWLAAQANRMRPDRIIIGEIRGIESEQFIHAANSGADGSMTTIHASSPRQALDKMTSFILKAGGDGRSELAALRDIASTVQIIIQTGIIDGKHYITGIEEVSRTIRKEGGSIASASLFEYDREKNLFTAVNRPSEELVSYMKTRGVPVDFRLFQNL
jgi:pilus assembly protein CpaF